MALSELTKKMAQKSLDDLFDKRVPIHVRDKIRFGHTVRGNSITLLEIRPVYNDPTRHTEMSVAQFRYDDETKKWTLYCCDRNSKWHEYLDILPSNVFADLVAEVDRDPTGIFWG